jgi:putative endonuclease
MSREVFQPATYILANRPNGTLYVGCTSNLVQRIYQHREGLVDGFTKLHDIKRLVWFELHATMDSAITAERNMKEWKRAWKVSRILHLNPNWDDLYPTIM